MKVFAHSLIVTRIGGELTVHAGGTGDGRLCKVGFDSADPDNPYCVNNGCTQACVLKSEDLGNGSKHYWCDCE